MKVSVIVATNSEVVGSSKNEILNLICSQAYKNGLDVVCKFALRFDIELVKQTLKMCREICDAIIFISDTDFEKSYIIKKIVCDEYLTKLVINNFAKANIEEFLKMKNVPFKKEDQTFMQLPENSRCIKNQLGVFQGFLLEENGKSLFFLPFNTEQLYRMFFASALPYILKKKDVTTCTYVFKTFGIRYNEMTSILKDEIKNKFGVQIVCMEHLLDGEVIIFVPANKKIHAQEILSLVYTKLLPYIYSESDASLPEAVYEILQVRNKKLVLAEDFTCGKILNLFFEKVGDFRQVLLEGFTSFDASNKIRLFGVDENVLKTPKPDLSEVAYQMALGALNLSGADIAVATLGDVKAGNLVFAIGTKEGIHVYSETVVGAQSQKVEMATNIVLLKLLKKIKKDNFNLGEVV